MPHPNMLWGACLMLPLPVPVPRVRAGWKRWQGGDGEWKACGAVVLGAEKQAEEGTSTGEKRL